MVGNSPKSDINPALAAGLHAVLIPHDNTWILEREELAAALPSQRLLVVERFGDLQKHF
jgi:putative hydrolase of the HAD superfamily